MFSPGRSGEEWEEKGKRGERREIGGEKEGEKEGERKKGEGKRGQRRGEGNEEGARRGNNKEGEEGGRRDRRGRSWCSFTCSQILDHRVGVENFLGSKQCILTMYSVVVLHMEGGGEA